MRVKDFYREIRALPKGELLHLRVGHGFVDRREKVEDYILMFGQWGYERRKARRVIKRIEPLDRRVVAIYFNSTLQMYMTEHRGTRAAGPMSYNVETRVDSRGCEEVIALNRGEAAIQEFLRKQNMQHLEYVVQKVLTSPGYQTLRKT